MLSHKIHKRALGFVAAATLVYGASPVSALDEPFQQPPLELVASDFLPESVLSGEGYTVEKRVDNDGVQNTYTIKSDYGVLTVTGTDELLARVALESRGWKVTENVSLASECQTESCAR